MDKSRKIKILRDLIEINSINGNETEIRDYLVDLLKIHGIENITIMNFDGNETRGEFIAEIGDQSSDKVLAFDGHLDTVSVENPDAWMYDPFDAKQVGKKIFGRGSADMKSGLAAMVISLIELHEEGFTPRGRLRVIGTASEELGAQGAVELTEKGYVHDITAMVVGEPTHANIIYAHNGQFDYQVEAFGKSAHSSAPSKGINAIQGLIRFIAQEAECFKDVPADKMLGPLVHSITTFHGGSQINSIPGYAKLEGNIRPLPEFGTKKVASILRNIVKHINSQEDVTLKFSIIDQFEAIATQPDDEFVQLVQSARTEVFGLPAKELVIHGGTDASAYVADNNGPIVLLGSGKWADAHTDNESVEIDEYFSIIETYERVAKKYLV